jgi:preprotein translocase subunit SecA
MLENILAKISQRELYSYKQIVEKINRLEESMKILTDEELKEKTQYFRSLIENGSEINELLPEAFAVIREASSRVLGLRHYDVQLIGGCILHAGKIAEMKTGEGKTLVAILPAYLNALKNSVHIVTVNEYLAKRDSLSIGRVLKFMGLNVGLILQDMDIETRRENYACDVVYSTNSELGFDYLRDNLATDLEEKVQNGFNFAIVDEVDSVLIDEARTPLIISQPSQTNKSKYLTASNLALVLQKDLHYEIDRKSRNILLTEDGTFTAEYVLGVKSLYQLSDSWALYVINALKAKEFYIRDKEYLVENDKVSIIDEYTGRVLNGRRWGDGLHQAIEAKERVKIENETVSLASITYQNFFLFYKKLSGMTGTALTEQKEFKKIYQLNVECVPTNKKVQRVDEKDVVYKSLYAKWRAVLDECLTVRTQGRPILIGTSSVENSEIISALLKECGVEHNLLNAKPENAAKESETVAQAGRKGAVTIATNMAGRGTDILLGGNPSFLAKAELRSFIESNFSKDELNKFEKKGIENLLSEVEIEYGKIELNEKQVTEAIDAVDALMSTASCFEKALKNLYEEVKVYHEEQCNLEKAEVVALGGLHIIGTEKHESRRIDNQLRGRAGRQGDPGSSKFFLSFEDNLLQVFGGESLKKIISQLDLDDDLPIEGGLINSSIDGAQKKIEELHYESRKNLFNFDNVLNIQRNIVYTERNRFLEGNITDYKKMILQYLEQTVNDVVNQIEECKDKELRKEIYRRFCKKFICLPYVLDIENLEELPSGEVRTFLTDHIKVAFELKQLEIESIESNITECIESRYLLQSMDSIWQEHLAQMNLLKESMGWRAYGQKDPLLEYQKESYTMFLNQIVKIRQNSCYLMMATTSFG